MDGRVVRFVIVVAALAFVADGVALGQPTAAARPPAKAPEAPQKRVSAVRVPNGSIVVDGRLDEGEWQSATPATDFVQQQPREGAPATHRSEVRFLYDDDNLYVGGRFTEDEIDRLVVNELKRDFIARDGDLVVLNLDTFRDKLNAYNFQTNPACALRDSQSYDEGRNINANWDGVWTCRSSIEADGFVIEQAIPFKQLRFPRQAEQEWGFNYLPAGPPQQRTGDLDAGAPAVQPVQDVVRRRARRDQQRQTRAEHPGEAVRGGHPVEPQRHDRHVGRWRHRREDRPRAPTSCSTPRGAPTSRRSRSTRSRST